MPIQSTVTGSGSSLTGLGIPSPGGGGANIDSLFGGWMKNLEQRRMDALAREEAWRQKQWQAQQEQAATSRALAIQEAQRAERSSALDMEARRQALTESKKDAALMDTLGPRHYKTGAVSAAPAGGFADTSLWTARMKKVLGPDSATMSGGSSPGGFGAAGERSAIAQAANEGMSPEEEAGARRDAFVRQNPYSSGMMQPFNLESDEEYKRRREREAMGAARSFGGFGGSTGADLSIYGG